LGALAAGGAVIFVISALLNSWAGSIKTPDQLLALANRMTKILQTKEVSIRFLRSLG